jgi:hypothetical protein
VAIAVKGDLEIFEYLKSKVNAGNIIFYFSWCHIVEAMKYDSEHTELLESYCTGVDTLTEGNCILYPDDLTQRELTLFLGDHFSFIPCFGKADYAYSKFKDAVPGLGDWLPPDTGKQILKEPLSIGV